MTTLQTYKLHKRIACPEISDYLRMVEKREVEVCEEQIKLAKHVRNVFATEKLFIDQERLARYLDCQRYFPFDLFPWEKYVFTLWLCVFQEDGNPRWPELLELLGRGAGKNGFMSFAAFCLTTNINGIPDYHVDICATTEDQAKTSFDDVYQVLDKPENKILKKMFRWTYTFIKNITTGSIIRFRTDNPKSKDGLRSGAVFFDEIHAFADWLNMNVFTTGLGKKPHPRKLYCTTDGDIRDGVLDALKKKAQMILDGEIPDNGFLPFICKLDNVIEVDDPTKWVKANPSLTDMPSLRDQMLREYQDYKLDPINNSGFMTKRMNIPQGNKDIEVTTWENILATNREVPDLLGKPCVCGIDFARSTDFISAFLLFRVDGIYYGIHHSWLCTHSKDIKRMKIPLDDFAKLGILTIVDDVEISPEIITAWIYEQSQLYNIKKVSIDEYRHTLFMTYLREIGFEAKDKMVFRTRPSDIMRVQVLINSVFATKKIIWGDDPLMRWFTNNTKLEAAPNNNYKYGKIEGKSRKTDGFMAFVAAMCTQESIPEEQELVFLPLLKF